MMLKPSLRLFLQAAKGDLLVTAFAVFLTIASFWTDDATAYLFPQILSVCMLTLCLMQLMKVAKQQAPAAQEKLSIWMRLLHGNGKFFIIIITIIGLAETLGFYVSAFLGYLAIALLGSKKSLTLKTTLLIIIIAGATCLTLYLLFTVLLKVQVPHGLIY